MMGTRMTTGLEVELIQAASAGNADKVRALVEEGAEVNARHNSGITAVLASGGTGGAARDCAVSRSTRS